MIGVKCVLWVQGGHLSCTGLNADRSGGEIEPEASMANGEPDHRHLMNG
jgi:hypothetical protein